MAKRLVEIDDDVLSAARAELGTRTIKDTVNESLRLAAGRRDEKVTAALEALARFELEDRAAAWR